MKMLLCAAILLAAVGCGGGSSNGGGDGNQQPACTAANAQATTSVAMANGMLFIPSCIKITRGATVTWTNDDAVTINHTVLSDTAGEPFSSPVVVPGGTFQHTFSNTAQTVRYHCTLHGTVMSGTVVIE
jgi:plastocyanin